MAPDWTDSPETITIMIVIMIVAVSTAVWGGVKSLIDDYRKANADRPPRRKIHL